MEIDLPDVIAEVSAAFARYEQALVSNDVATLERAVSRRSRERFAMASAKISMAMRRSRSFRAARSPVGLARRTAKTVITTYGRDFAIASTLFYRDAMPGKVGRQMQTWVRFPEGWRVVAAHVSVIDEPKADST